MKKVTRKELILLGAVLAVFSIFVLPRMVFRSDVGARRDVSLQKHAAPQYYCPMHPTYTSDRPGDCPICNMKLVPKPGAGGKEKKERKILYYRNPMGQPDTSPVPKKDPMGMDYIPVYEDEAQAKASSVAGHAAVHIPFEKQQLMGVKLDTVKKQKMTREIHAAGRVAYDPELYSAQQEYLSAIDSLKRVEGSSYHEPVERTQSLVEAARMRLRLLGMSGREIEELERISAHDQNLILPKEESLPMSSASAAVWVYANIYEYEIPFVKTGSSAKFRTLAFAGKEFYGEVRAVKPVLNQETRSADIRIDVPNPEGLLRPHMYGDVFIQSDAGEVLSAPKDAVMFTGERTLVYVHQGGGRFEPHEVILGAESEDFYEIKSGLEEGDSIAMSANFLIDSESRLQAAFSGTAEGGHQHGP